MSVMTPQNTTPSGERRRHVRKRPSSIVSVKLDNDNGGILLNLGTGGLSFQAVARVNPEQDLILHFKLFDTGEAIAIAGRVAWLGPTRKEAGVCFKDLPDRTEQSIAGWIARQETGSHATEWKMASPVNAVPAASEIPLLPPQVSIVSIPASGPALDPQPSPSTALPSESHLGDTLPDPASSKPSTPLAFGASLPSPIPTNALHPKEHSAAPTVNPTEVPSEPHAPHIRRRQQGPASPQHRTHARSPHNTTPPPPPPRGGAPPGAPPRN